MLYNTFINPRTTAIACLTLAILAGGLSLIPQLASAQEVQANQSEIAAVELEKQKLLLELIHKLRETILRYERQLTIERGQTPGENLINQNSVAYTQKAVRLYETPDYKGDYSSQDEEELGEVVQGPRLVDGEVWWKFAFKDGKEGWSPEQHFTREPSVTISYDENKDGIHDFKVRFIGEYNVDQFYAEQSEGGTYIRYRGDSGVEPFSITEL